MSAVAAKADRFNLIKYIDNWMFGKGSPVTLGVFRIVIASLAFINLAMIAIDFDAWFTERGYVPIELQRRYAGDFMTGLNGEPLTTWLPRLNGLAGATSTIYTAIFYGILMLAALFTIAGLWTRISSVVLAVGMVSLHHRNLLILHGGDTMLRQLLWIIAIAPSGAACSVDRLIAVWKGKAPQVPEPISLWGQRLVQMQIAILYLTAVWWKWQGGHWRDGTATYFIANLKEFDRFWVPTFMERQPVVGITTYSTLLVELALATLVFYRPFRKWVLLGGLALHGYIEYRFNIPMFAFITTCGYMCFYEGEETAAWARRLGQRFKALQLRVLTPKGQRLVGTRGAMIHNLDPFGLVRYEEGESDKWEATTPSGGKRDPFNASWLRSIGSWPLALIWRRLLVRAAEPVSPEGTVEKPVKEPAAAPGA